MKKSQVFLESGHQKYSKSILIFPAARQKFYSVAIYLVAILCTHVTYIFTYIYIYIYTVSISSNY